MRWVFVALLSCLTWLPTGPALAKPNVLFLFADDQRPDSIAALGNDVVKTPNLDALVERGFTFRNTYCMGSTMGAVCNPSRHMTLSGRALFHYDPTEPRNTFGDVMGKTGYTTWHLSKRGNTARAYHTAFHHSDYLNDFKERESGHHGRTGADRAITFLKQEWKREKPFFMYLGFTGPHDPRVASQEWLELYQRQTIPLPKNYLPFHPFDNGEMVVRDERLAPWPRTEAVVQKHLHDYYACISSIDHNVGRIVQTLREMNQLENTIIVYSADHGLAVGSHGLFGKQSLYEHSMKAPLVIAGPGIEIGESDALAYLYDIFPTVVDLVGGSVPEGLDGKSLVPVLRRETEQVRDAVFLAYRDVQRAVRDRNWKLIRYPKVDVTQLFDLSSDPDELVNLSDSASHAEHVRRLTQRLGELQSEFHDSAPLTVGKARKATVDETFFKNAVNKTARSGNPRAKREKFPGKAQRILFLGDSITHAGTYIHMLESALRIKQGTVPEMINLGLPSETCTGLSEPDHPFPRPNVHDRLERALSEVKPDLVVACYGMNDGIYHPFSEERFKKFQNGIKGIIYKVHSAGAKLVLMTPPPFDPLPMRESGRLASAGAEKYAWFSVYENYDSEVLSRYSKWILQQRDRVERVINLRDPVLKYVAVRRKTNPSLVLSNDGVHLNAEGHRVLADAIHRAWGHGEMWRPDADTLSLVAERSNLLHDAWLTHVGHERPGMKAGLPLEDARTQAATLETQIRAALPPN